MSTRAGANHPQIRPTDWLTTELQVPAHKSFAPEPIAPRGDRDYATVPEGPEAFLASPPDWAVPDDLLPCQVTATMPKAEQERRLELVNGGSRQAAAKLCSECPVRAQCLEDAMEQEGTLHRTGRFLVRGGLLPNTRAKLAKQGPEAILREIARTRQSQEIRGA